jgi:hypothetical protein
MSSSGSALVFKYYDFAQSARFHVENESAHGNIFGDPGMRPDFLDLLPGIVHVARPTESAAMK